MIKKSTIYEMFLFIYLIIICLVPMPSNYFAMFSIIIGLTVFPLWFIRRKNKSASPIFYLFSFILIWALISTSFNYYPISIKYILLPLFFALITMLIPYLFSKLIANSIVDARKHIFIVSILITISVAVYALRLYVSSPGFIRLSSPIGGSATIHLALSLTLAVYLANLKIGFKKGLSIFLTIITILMIVLSGARAGILTMVLLFLTLVINKKKPFRSIGLSVFIGVIGYAIFKLIATDRFYNLESPLRSITFETSMNIIASSFSNLFFGTGYGVVWPWYAFAENVLYKPGEMMNTIYGEVLVHPHSVLLGLITELGLIGLIPFLILCIIIIKQFLNSAKTTDQFKTTLLYGIICTFPAITLDYYLFVNNTVSLIWWYFVFFAVSINIEKDLTKR